MKNVLTTIAIILSIKVYAQNYKPNLLKNINPNLYSTEYILYHSKIYFAANNGSTPTVNTQLWVTDGTANGTVLVKNITGASNGSNPQNFIILNDTLFFLANDGLGVELWKTDGTTNGTVIVKDINPGTPSSVMSSPFLFNNRLYFYADDNINGVELWVTDGSTNGTKMVKNINPTGDSYPQYFSILNGKLYFSADDGIHGVELWVTDGTINGTVMVKDINTSASSYPTNLFTSASKIFFNCYDVTTGGELWVTDGTANGTVMVKDINTGSSSSLPSNFTSYKNSVYFTTTGVNTMDRELWKTDGTPSGTSQIITGFLSINNFFEFKNKLFFSGTRANDSTQLWVTDGTTTTLFITPNNFSSANPLFLYSDNSAFYFALKDATHGTELWSSDGIVIGTKMILDIDSGSASSSPSLFFILNGKKYVYATGINGTQWYNLILVPKISIAITTGSNPTCSNNEIIFKAIETNGGTAPSYQWKINNVPQGINDSLFTTLVLNNDIISCVLTSNSIEASPLIAISNNLVITVNAAPITPTITQAGQILTSSISNNYQWYINDTILSGQTNQILTITKNGRYRVTVKSGNCISSSTEYIVSTDIKEVENNILLIYPNPIRSGENLNFKAEINEVIIYDVRGTEIYHSQQKNINKIILPEIKNGVYFIKTKNEKGNTYSKLIIE